MKKLIIATTLTSLLLAFSYPSQAWGKSESSRDNRYTAEKKRDRGHNVSRKKNTRKVRKEHKKQSRKQKRKHPSKVYANARSERNVYRAPRQHARPAATHYNSNYYSAEPYYARSHSDYYGRYYGYYNQYGNYQEYDYGYYDDHGRYQAHRHNSSCGHLATPILGAVVAGVVIASIFD